MIKIDRIIKHLNNKYPSDFAFEKDYFGHEISGKIEINKILLVLDLTLESINYAINSNFDLIISHHPLVFGNYNEVVFDNNVLQEKIKLLTANKINVFSIHTNIDFNPINSLDRYILKKLKFSNINKVLDNTAIVGNFENDFDIKFISEKIRSDLMLNYKFRTNVRNNKKFSNIILSTGAGGYILEGLPKKYWSYLFITGELKYHEWILARDMNLKVLELGHFSENIFKDVLFEDIIDFVGAKNSVIIKKYSEVNPYEKI